MEKKLQSLYEECINELKSINIDVIGNDLIGDINISIAKRNAKRYGCCKHENPDERYRVITNKGYRKYVSYERFYTNNIEISKWVLDLNENIIKNTIMHEIIHCFPFCNNHGSEFKKYANYINSKLGYNVSRVGDKKEDYKESNLEFNEDERKYNYKIECEKCGMFFFRQRFNKNIIRHYRCGKCGGKLKALSFK